MPDEVTMLTPERERCSVEMARRFSQKFAGMLWRGSLPRFFYVADSRGRIVDTRPAQKFPGLKGLIRAGRE